MDVTATVATGDLDRSGIGRASLGVLRIGVAILWIQNAGWKVPPDFGADADRGLYFWASQAVEFPVFAPYSWLVETLVLPNIHIFGWVILLMEAALGAFLLVGLATRFWALVGIAQTVAISLSVLNAPHEWHWSYYLMALAHVVLLATAAGRYWGLDGFLRAIWQKSTGRLAALADEGLVTVASLQRATLVLGFAAVVGCTFVLTSGLSDALDLIRVRGVGAIALAFFGVLAVLAGARGIRTLGLVSGLGLLLCAVLQLAQLGQSFNVLGGDGSTMALFGGLGIGLTVVWLAGRATTPEGTPST